MTEYVGNRSLDAEITLDLSKGVVNMDYSLNKHQSGLDSNTSACIDDYIWNEFPALEKLKYSIPNFLFFCIIIIPFEIFQIVFVMEQKIGMVGKTAQYEYQKILKWYYTKLWGIWTQTKSGELNDKKLSFTIPNNLWIEYYMTEDYQRYVMSVSLVRNFVDYLRGGLFLCRKQRGWNVVFNFSEPPKNGLCSIKYVGN